MIRRTIAALLMTAAITAGSVSTAQAVTYHSANSAAECSAKMVAWKALNPGGVILVYCYQSNGKWFFTTSP